MANGRGAAVEQTSPLAREPFLAVAEVAGSATQGRIVLAAPISLGAIEEHFAERIEAREQIIFEPQNGTLRGRLSRALGAIVLAERPVPVAADEASARILADGIVRLGLDRLPWSKALSAVARPRHFPARRRGRGVAGSLGARAVGASGRLVGAALYGKTGLAELLRRRSSLPCPALVPHALRRRLDAEAPTHFARRPGLTYRSTTKRPKGRNFVRVQELFGLDRHPTIAAGRVPLVVEFFRRRTDRSR